MLFILFLTLILPYSDALTCSRRYGDYIDHVDGYPSYVRVQINPGGDNYQFVSLTSVNSGGQVGTVGGLEATRTVNLDVNDDLTVGQMYDGSERNYFDIEFNFDCTPLLDCFNSGMGNGTESVTLTTFNNVTQANETCQFDLEGLLSKFICTPSFNFDYSDNTTSVFEITLSTLDDSNFVINGWGGGGGGSGGGANYSISNSFSFDTTNVLSSGDTYCGQTTMFVEFQYDCTPLSVCRTQNVQPDAASYGVNIETNGTYYSCQLDFVGSLDDPPTGAPTQVPTLAPITELDECIQDYQDCVEDCEAESICADERACIVTCGQDLQQCQDQRLACPGGKGGKGN